MSNDTNKPNYNLRTRRGVNKRDIKTYSEGIISASAMLYSESLGRDDQGAEADTEGSDTSQELVPHLPANASDEGRSAPSASGQPETTTSRDPGLSNSSGESQGRPSTPPHSPVDEEEVGHQSEVFRLRVQVRNRRNHKVMYFWIPINTLL